jgi:undecaprenyl-diphosphatase
MAGYGMKWRVLGRRPRLGGRLAWLGLALLSAAALYPLTATAVAGGLSAGDAAVRDFVLANRFSVLDPIMLFFSWAASEYVTPVILAAFLLAGWRRARRLALVGVGVAATSTVWQIALKAIAGRLRPEPLLYPIWHGAGFPSGHILTALVLTFLLWRAAPALSLSRRATVALGWIALTYPVLVGISRIYLNCHYLSDVVGGFLLGTGHLGLAFALLGTGWLAAEQAPDGGFPTGATAGEAQESLT